MSNDLLRFSDDTQDTEALEKMDIAGTKSV